MMDRYVSTYVLFSGVLNAAEVRLAVSSRADAKVIAKIPAKTRSNLCMFLISGRQGPPAENWYSKVTKFRGENARELPVKKGDVLTGLKTGISGLVLPHRVMVCQVLKSPECAGAPAQATERIARVLGLQRCG